ncbi:MAG: hypothetical protein JXQ73_11310 [Phycisphaerae bacterium]|nr:hypothetical protein [Phycisphaerae bacterium]
MARSVLAGTGLVALTVAGARGEGGEAGLSRLGVLEGGYPRAFFFRAAEGMASNPRMSYARWSETFSRLMGIEGKALDEEIPGRSKRNIEFFTRFKREHPEQLVLLHYNGNGRDPRDASGGYFGGHWLYYNGATIVADVPASEGESEIRVSDARLFHLNMGRYRNANEDVGVCVLDEGGRPDWSASEQAQLVAIDLKRNVLRVRRGCYGTRPRGFRAGKAYAAAHVTEGPWGKGSHLLWYYNFSPCCPRDAEGRRCSDVLLEELVGWFSPGGKLAAFDGVEFDVMHHQRFRPGQRKTRGADADADGRIDDEVVGGRNVQGLGVIEFCRRLRERLGEEKLILADGTTVNSQRAFGILNGIESEGWPWLGDWEINDWSGGLNRHFYWRSHGRRPVLNYVNHKFTTGGAEPGSRVRPEVPFKVHRLVLAAAQFTDSAVCYSYAPDSEPGERFGIWDELWMGVRHRLGWLGKPLGPAVRVAMEGRDLLGGEGRSVAASFVRRFSGDGVTIAADGDRLRVEGKGEGDLAFRLRGVPCEGRDLFVSVTMSGKAMAGYPVEAARLTWVGIAASDRLLISPEVPYVGMQVRGGPEVDADAETGAAVRFFRKRALGGEARDCYMVHPPYRGGTGCTFWQRDVAVPVGGRLEFYLGMGEKAPARSDGVTFRVLIAEARDGKAGAFAKVFESAQVESRWTRHEVSLAKWGGKTVRLRFVADCGPRDNATTDHGHWADVRLLGGDGADEVTEPVGYMTWTGEEAFTSGFYFRDVRSKAVDLEFKVEGSEAVWLSGVTAHARPDVMYREFERGVVLANPSDREYAFDLPAMFAGRSFRRLQGSSRQDPQTNDGSEVSGKLVLQAREGLFLIRADARP